MKSVTIFILTFLIALNAARNVNNKSLNLIKGYEGWRSCAYSTDGANRLTIGYGHLVKPSDGFNKKSCITKERGLQILKSDLSTATNCIEKNVRVPLTDNQFGALVSWTFNVGCGAARKSSLVRKLNAKSPANVICDQLRQWNKGGGKVLAGLKRRREAECTLYKS